MVAKSQDVMCCVFRLGASLIIFVCIAAGCVATGPLVPTGVCPELTCADWRFLPFSHRGIPLVGFRKPGGDDSDRLIVYIEGDGKGWRSRSRLSMNPTPIDPIGLRLAVQDARPGIIYLARPCQYVHPKLLTRCHPSLWSTARYSEHVVETMSRAITAAKRSQGDRLTLVGYSGGGVIATLLASRRSDVDRLITIATPLDTKTWVEYHGVSLLEESLNPLMNTPADSVREFHFHGGRDQIVPSEVIKRYIRQATREKIQFFTIAEYNHSCCWVRDWPTLLAMIDEQGRPSRFPVGTKLPARLQGVSGSN